MVLVMKLKVLSLAVGLAFMSAQAMSSVSIDQEDYQKLLPKNNKGNVVYTINLANDISVKYHCNIKEQGQDFVLDESTCDTRKINFKSDYPNRVKIDTLDTQSELTIVEHKLWAMAFAHAAMNSMVLMQYGLDKEGGTFQLDKPFGVTGEYFGDYFMRNMGPNYYLSKGLQESSLGDDLPNSGMGNGDDDGVLQVEYPGSAWSELEGAGGGGFPIIFAAMNPESVLSSNNGPARNILGSAATSAYYNASATAINTGSLPWDQGNQSLPQNRLHEFIQSSADPMALAKMLSFMYNRGPYAAKDQPLKDEKTFNHCVQAQELENDWDCFRRQNDFGTRYIRQIPDVTKQLNASDKQYNANLTWKDLQAYLTLLRDYGFYTGEEFKVIKANVRKTFDRLKGENNFIKYKAHFGKIIETVVTSVPVKVFGEAAQVDPGKQVSVYSAGQFAQEFMSARAADGSVVYNDWLEPKSHVALPVGSRILNMTHAATDYGCASAINGKIASIEHELDESNPVQINYTVQQGECSAQVVAYSEPEVTPLPDGWVEWEPGVTQVSNGDKVIYGGACYMAKNNPGIWETPPHDWFWDVIPCP